MIDELLAWAHAQDIWSKIDTKLRKGASGRIPMSPVLAGEVGYRGKAAAAPEKSPELEVKRNNLLDADEQSCFSWSV